MPSRVTIAHARDCDVVLFEDCCCAHSEIEHKNSIGSVGRFCQIGTSASVDFAAAWTCGLAAAQCLNGTWQPCVRRNAYDIAGDLDKWNKLVKQIGNINQS